MLCFADAVAVSQGLDALVDGGGAGRARPDDAFGHEFMPDQGRGAFTAQQFELRAPWANSGRGQREAVRRPSGEGGGGAGGASGVWACRLRGAGQRQQGGGGVQRGGVGIAEGRDMGTTFRAGCGRPAGVRWRVDHQLGAQAFVGA